MFKRFNSAAVAWPILIVLAITLMSVFFYIAMLFYFNTVNERSSKIYNQSLTSFINQYEYLPALLATDDSIKDIILNSLDDHTGVSKRLRFITERSGANDLYIMDISGTVRATSNYNSPNSFLNQNYSFRPYFKDAVSQKKQQFYYAKGATTGIPGFFIASPIIVDTTVIGVAVAKIDLRMWEENWKTAGEDVIVADNNGIVILSAKEGWRYRSLNPLSDDTLKIIDQQKQFKNIALTSLFTKSIGVNFPDNDDAKAFWVIDGKLYLVNPFDIKETGWRLYYLVKHDNILNSSIAFFLITSMLAAMAHITLRERRHKLKSQQQHRTLEQQRRQELQAVMDNIHIGVVVFSHDGLLYSVNDHAKHLLLKGKDLNLNSATYINELINISEDDFDTLLLEDIAAPAYHETNAIDNNKPTMPVMFAISQLEAMSESLYLMTIVNIQRRKKVENEIIKINQHLEETISNRTKELHSAQTALMQKNKATALGNMAATIVHEISQPLAAMNSSIAAANAKIEKEDWSGAAASIGRLSPLNKKMHSIIKLLKFFSYQDEESKEITNLYKLVAQSLDNFNDSFSEHNISVSINCEQPNLYINVNPLKMDLVISNIIKNAIDATEHKQQPQIIITIKQQGEQAQVTIKDNGEGVSPDILKQLFNPYFTTKQVGKGLGLGLSITYEIVQEYGGNISVANSNKGADFFINLPLAKNNTATVNNHG